MILLAFDTNSFCKLFYASHYIPISYYSNGLCLSAYGFGSENVFQGLSSLSFDIQEIPSIIIGKDLGFYGIVKLSGDDFVVIGPAYSGNVIDDSVHHYMTDNVIPKDKEQETAEFLRGIPQCSYNQFLNLLSFIYFLFNNKELGIYEYSLFSQSGYEGEIAVRQASFSYDAREEQIEHGTFNFEKRMLDYVKRGNTSAMKSFLLQTAQQEQLTEGRLADDPLRQAKNLFIGAVTLVGKNGAIPGGLDVEQAYQLIDTYIQECEHLQDINEIKKLQFNMLIDFTNRVENAQSPGNISNEVFSCIQFIKTHVNEPIGISEVTNHSGKSRAYITKKFKDEVGINIGEYIINSKMDEAKTLLKYTDKSLGAISNYLCFSSQSYFQNVFKKKYGITPAKYRQNYL